MKWEDDQRPPVYYSSSLAHQQGDITLLMKRYGLFVFDFTIHSRLFNQCAQMQFPRLACTRKDTKTVSTEIRASYTNALTSLDLKECTSRDVTRFNKRHLRKRSRQKRYTAEDIKRKCVQSLATCWREIYNNIV